MIKRVRGSGGVGVRRTDLVGSAQEDKEASVKIRDETKDNSPVNESDQIAQRKKSARRGMNCMSSP